MPTKQYFGGCGLGVQWRACGDVYEQWFMAGDDRLYELVLRLTFQQRDVY
jgi:hypothetical protein